MHTDSTLEKLNPRSTAQVESGPLCPRCPNDNMMERIDRKTLQRLLLGSKRYRCYGCYKSYLKILGIWIRS